MKPIIIKSRSEVTTTKYTFLTDSFSVESTFEYTNVCLVFKDSMGREEVVVQYDYLPSDLVDYDVIFSIRYQCDLREEIIETVQDYVEEYLLSDEVILDAENLIAIVAEKAFKFYQAFAPNFVKEESVESSTNISTPYDKEQLLSKILNK